MTATAQDPAVRSYLKTLHNLLQGAPDQELVVDGVRQHIIDALGPEAADPARVRDVLHELGDPAAIAADARTGTNPTPLPFLQRRAGAILTVLLLTIGAFVIPVAGWIVGLGLLWFSTGWTLVDKLTATLAPIALTVLLLGLAYLFTPFPAHLGLLGGFALGSIGAAVFLLARFREGGRAHTA